MPTVIITDWTFPDLGVEEGIFNAHGVRCVARQCKTEAELGAMKPKPERYGWRAAVPAAHTVHAGWTRVVSAVQKRPLTGGPKAWAKIALVHVVRREPPRRRRSASGIGAVKRGTATAAAVRCRVRSAGLRHGVVRASLFIVPCRRPALRSRWGLPAACTVGYGRARLRAEFLSH